MVPSPVSRRSPVRFVTVHRRLLAAGCAALAVLLATAAIRDTGEAVEVVVAAAELPSGHVLTERDVRTLAVPPDLVADHALGSPSDAVGRRLGGPVRRGETLTDARLVEPVTIEGHGDVPDDAVLATIGLSDATARQGLRVGDRVDVVAIDPAADQGADPEEIARGLPVVALPEVEDAASVVVVADRETAVRLAAAGVRAALTVLATLP